MPERLLITGATSRVGSALLENLDPMNIELRALAHDESKAKSVRERCIEAVLGDFPSRRPWVPLLRAWVRSSC